VGDAPAMADIDRRTSESPRSSGHYERCCRGQGPERALVFVEGAGVRGFVLFATVLDEGSINTVAVSPERQGRGLGRALVREALAVMRKENARRCLLEVRVSNVAALHLYESLGFVEDGRRANYYRTESGREDALLMSMLL
jgi:ribosomal-protein-alanine N-acetyltransferase